MEKRDFICLLYTSELEHRGLRFTRYADDVLIFTKSEMAANRVMNSISDWLEPVSYTHLDVYKRQ